MCNNNNKLFQETLNRIIEKVDRNISIIGDDLREFSDVDGEYFGKHREDAIELSNINNWTQSFFTGMAFWNFRVNGNSNYLKWINSFYEEYYSKVFVTPLDTMHDLGFLYTPYAVSLYKLTGTQEMKEIGLKAADCLAKRLLPKSGVIRAWCRMDNYEEWGYGLAIIDCMMNLPLLFWASEVSGDPFYKNVAISHADNTIKYFVREDYSVCHAYRFNEETGAVIGEANYCGYSVGSHWARGTTWAIYGFAIAYRYTKNEKYLDTAINLAKKFVSLCEEDGVPVWDFRLPEDKPGVSCANLEVDWDITKKENTIYNRDTSAAAIVICGIYEIAKHKEVDELSKYAEDTLKVLCEKYFDDEITKDGILKCQNGQMRYTSFGDYYFMEALVERLYDFECIW
jgi:unsaturated chondroitin disaccharide hydrolase